MNLAPVYLLPEDRTAQMCGRLVQDMRLRLQSLREENDSGDPETTAKRRGRIAELKEWLSLLEPEETRPGDIARTLTRARGVEFHSM